jgi:hypothetical protein
MDEVSEKTQGWFAGRIPEGWFEGAPEVTADRDEVLVVGKIPEPEYAKGATATATAKAETRAGRIQSFREETRGKRMRIAQEAERRFGRKISWGVDCGEDRTVFTTLSVPAMTRLRMDDRQVLDTLIDAGVARSRSEALAWCVKLVGSKQGEWLGDLRQALTAVEKVRAGGPMVV